MVSLKHINSDKPILVTAHTLQCTCFHYNSSDEYKYPRKYCALDTFIFGNVTVKVKQESLTDLFKVLYSFLVTHHN